MLPYDDIARAITASHLSTPLTAAIWAEADEQAARVADRLRPGRFDQAPVRRAGSLLGFVTRADLEAAPTSLIADLFDPVSDGAFVSTNAPVRIVVEALVDRPLLFVVEGRHVTGFIVRADLNKHAARTHYYLLVADLELALVALLRRSYRRVEPLLRNLPSKARHDAKKRFERDLKTSTDLDVLSAMQFGDVIQIVGRSPRVLRAIGFKSAGDFHAATHRLRSFRTAVMHPVAPFVGAWSVEDIASIEVRLRSMLHEAWNALREPPPG